MDREDIPRARRVGSSALRRLLIRLLLWIELLGLGLGLECELRELLVCELLLLLDNG